MTDQEMLHEVKSELDRLLERYSETKNLNDLRKVNEGYRKYAELERELRSGDSVEIESKRIGSLVAARLKKIDKVAYIRFSSVFKQFLDLEDFQKELEKLVK